MSIHFAAVFLEIDPWNWKISFSPVAKPRMQAGLASLKRISKAKENHKQTRTPQGIPEQKAVDNKPGHHYAVSSESKTDFTSIISGMRQMNSKTFTMPKTAQFEQKR
jgi:hypothetical protein